MLTELVQRRRERREFYRSAKENINPRDYEVAPVDYQTAKEFVETHHYSGTYPACTRRFGYFYRTGELRGIAGFGRGGNNKTVENILPGDAFPDADGEDGQGLELLRLVMLDSVPGNGETHFMGPCFRELEREGFIGVVSMADPVPRVDEGRRVVFPGHIGTIYQAFNAYFTGLATPRTKRLFADGTVYDGRTISKAKGEKKGWRYAAEQLRQKGLEKGLAIQEVPEDVGERRAWVDFWVPKVTSPLKHPGNYRYVWGFGRAVRRHVERQFPPQQFKYPKVVLPSDGQIQLF